MTPRVSGYCEWRRKISEGSLVRCQNQAVRFGPNGERFCLIHRHMAEGRPWPMCNPIPRQEEKP
jgi:hypothetical protein